MHPVLIMTYDKSPAITKAVAALEEAGLEVRVLNTAHAKLIDFLGALAGEDDEEEPQDPPKDEPKEEPKEEPAEEAPTDDVASEVAAESITVRVNDEPVKVVLIEGDHVELCPNSLSIGNKTTYALNEGVFSFWPVSLDEVEHVVKITVSESTDTAMHFALNVRIKEALAVPTLRVPKLVFQNLFTLTQRDAN